ncbi:pseudaminic acid synthase [Candidatus Margulisiibacteriota bacterium]
MFKIGPRTIGADQPVFIIAELSANHLQDYDLAVKTIKAMKEAGADAVKLQTYTPDTITLNEKNEYFQIKQGTLWDGKTLYQLYQEAYTPWDWQPKLKQLAEELGLICFSSPFDNSAVDFLEKMNVPAYKISSFEIADVSLIEYAASKGKPMILSTGIASLQEIEEAVAACKRAGNDQIALLKCASAYPAPAKDMNLRTILDLKERFGSVVGVSDHTLGTAAAVASIALGACLIEKHFILDRKLGGPDAGFSLEPAEFTKMVSDIREAEAALGQVSYELSDQVKRNRIFARSLFAVKDIEPGEIVTDEHIRSVRPGYGLAPKHLKDILGKKARTKILKGTPIAAEMIEVKL